MLLSHLPPTERRLSIKGRRLGRRVKAATGNIRLKKEEELI